MANASYREKPVLWKRGVASRFFIIAAGAALIFTFALITRADDDPTAPVVTVSTDTAPTEIVRTRAEVDALIQEAGRTPPAWWDTVQLNYPQTLDLTWDDSKRGPNNNLGGYL